MTGNRYRLAVLLLLTAASLTARADGGIDWGHRATQGPVTLFANPLSGEQRTAFYLARGFTAAAIRPYAGACGLSIGMQNAGTAKIATRLSDWRAMTFDDRMIALREPAAWDAEWEKAGLVHSARIAFRWAQFQTENVFEPGDWIMGMATLETRPTAPFRLLARYRDDQGDHEITLEGMSCAAD